MNKSVKMFLDTQTKKNLMDKHCFLYNESITRLLYSFENIEDENEKLEQKLLHSPDSYNILIADECEESLYEEIENYAYQYYCLLYEMKKETYLHTASLLYFNFDKTLRNWIVSEISRQWEISKLDDWLWKTDINNIFKILQLFNIYKEEQFKRIEPLKLIINVHKHGNGVSLKKLKNNYPEYLTANYIERGFFVRNNEYSELKISREHLEDFSNTILEIWKIIPEELHCNNVERISELIENNKRG